MRKHILQKIASKIPPFGRFISERDQMREAIDQLSRERCHLLEEVSSITSENLRLQQLLDEKNIGYCHCCRQQTTFVITGNWLRDQYLCTNCLSIPRQRHIQHILDTHFRGWDSLQIHESSPSNDLIARHCRHYSFSQYFESEEEGATIDGIRNENLESLTFPDDSFDLFITQDVFEHIFFPHLAAKEIMRVLKPGGAHVFTVPKEKHLPSSRPRARLVDSEIEYLDDPVYHGNPVGDGKALVTWEYGDDFEALIGRWSGGITTTYVTRDRSLGIDGEYIEVFVTKKPRH
ncbi:class I SAM-dependent methyltransferase [Methylococcus capsulatus]|uniref:class I SAM-dependent methyltransferase n=2 Tax=Methylococcus capsulatus TaxID=414 RepID=UPI001C533223|nr:class I SAM-dependent methyltransferase [Methylococcus capsulatus]QXP86879.1 class I SAM-dependent methyltransferase [Methylococcus capsulatus]QXP93443.1 class I SAM-dependent methyltransferase [Methylococcus capsulatus]